MSVHGDEQIGRVLGGRYRLVAAVGTGASATVYQADDVQLRRRVAVKVLHPYLAEDRGFLRRFQAEAQAAAALSHPNIMAVFDWGADEHIPYLVLEYLGGGSLRAMLDRGRLLSPSQALLVGLETSRGLDYAHRRGVVHRDIKPANLLFGEDRRLRIADFGLARAIAEAAWTEPSGVLLGTARYASPEQAKGEPIDGRSDVYSLALTLVESVTGEVPFAGETTVATLMNRLDRLMPVSAELGPLAAVIERAGRPDPAERSTAAELGQGLIAAAEKLPRPAPLALVATSAALSSRDATAIGARAGVPAAAAVGSTPVVPPPTAPAGAQDVTRPVVAPAPGVAATAVPPPARTELFDQDSYRSGRTLRTFLVVLAVLAVAAIIGAGVLLFHRSSTPTHPVDDLVGLPVGEARNRVATNGWNVTEVRQKNDAQPLDVVFKTTPSTGDLAEGESFVLYVSDGPTPSVLPPMVGTPVEQVMATLAPLDLKLVVSGQQFSETAPVNTVVAFTVAGQAVPEGATVDKGSTVNVIVSAGPEPRTIPQLAGLPADQVEQTLKGLGLVPARGEDVFDPAVATGLVAASNPPQGTQVARDSTVIYQVSKGADLVAVPNLYLMTLQQATAALNAAGLTVGPIVGDPSRVVVSSSPPFGSQAPRGSAVGLTFY
jgi:beta-lactam-binding protein with PASTA domain/tRNA A-37 threonylcarbamoyl transferase component Bud32